MRTIRTKVYKFDELSSKSQEKAIDNNRYFNMENDWWDVVYEDANNIGLKIKEFDIDRSSYCKGEFTLNTAEDVANKIIFEHGETCETYKTAKSFLEDVADIKARPSATECEDEDSETQELIEAREEEFLHSLCEDYLISLRNEYEYLTSDEAIKESLISNEYEFTREGVRI